MSVPYRERVLRSVARGGGAAGEINLSIGGDEASSLLEENAAALSEIARLEASLREQAQAFELREREMRSTMGEQRAELDDLTKSNHDLAGERARLVAAVRDAQTVRATCAIDEARH